jgi:hypothetical protein
VNFAFNGKFELSAGGKRVKKCTYSNQNINFDNFTENQSAIGFRGFSSIREYSTHEYGFVEI